MSNQQLHQVKFKNEIISGYLMDNNGAIYSVKNNEVLGVRQNKNGHAIVRLYVGGYLVGYRLDAMVLSTLRTYPEDTLRVSHLDGDNMNCHPSNLEPISQSYIAEKYMKKYNVNDINDIPEEWKVYRATPTIEISNLGNVRDVKTKEPIKLYDNFGYKWFFRNNTHYYVHRLVAELFIKNTCPGQFKYINHIDGVKDNNKVYNLEWCDTAMNAEHAAVLGKTRKYSEETIRRVCEMLQDGIEPIVIEDETKVDRKYISEIYRGKKHRYIAAEYVFPKRISLDELYNKELILTLMKSGITPKEAARVTGAEYNQSFISYYERLQREERRKRKLQEILDKQSNS